MNHDTRAKLEAWLQYFDDIGITQYYRDRAVQAELPASAESAPPTAASGAIGAAKASAPALRAATPAVRSARQAPSLFDVVDRVEGDSLERIREDIGDCKRCRLCEKRSNIVFGVGNPKAELVFVGEGPGRDEDLQGEPFVGRAGQLLTQMIEAMGLKRSDVYICNVVKCRPPENRLPERDEIATCSPFLIRQLDAIRPRVIVCLGAVAAKLLVGAEKGITRFRGEWFDYKGMRLMATYHPAYLLRNPAEKGTVWGDLKKVMAELGLKPPRRGA
jgi:DNA polymerase